MRTRKTAAYHLERQERFRVIAVLKAAFPDANVPGQPVGPKYPTILAIADRLYRRGRRRVDWADCAMQAVLEVLPKGSPAGEFVPAPTPEASSRSRWVPHEDSPSTPAELAAPVIDMLAGDVGASQRDRRLIRTFNQAMRLATAWGATPPHRHEVAKQLGVSADRLDKLLAASADGGRLEHRVTPGLDGELGELLRDEIEDTAPSPLDLAEASVRRQRETERAARLIRLLTPVEQAAVRGIKRPGISRQAMQAAKARGIKKLIIMAEARGWREERESAGPALGGRWTGEAVALAGACGVQRRGIRLVERSHDPAGTTAARMLGDRGRWPQPAAEGDQA